MKYPVRFNKDYHAIGNLHGRLASQNWPNGATLNKVLQDTLHTLFVPHSSVNRAQFGKDFAISNGVKTVVLADVFQLV